MATLNTARPPNHSQPSPPHSSLEEMFRRREAEKDSLLITGPGLISASSKHLLSLINLNLYFLQKSILKFFFFFATGD